MLIEIQRTRVTSKVKESSLRINGMKVCDCAETCAYRPRRGPLPAIDPSLQSLSAPDATHHHR